MTSDVHAGNVALSGWGRYPVLSCVLHDPSSSEDLVRTLERDPVIARGAGRAYGDSALQARGVIRMRGLGCGISLDAHQGVLVAEAGASFGDVLDPCKGI